MRSSRPRPTSSMPAAGLVVMPRPSPRPAFGSPPSTRLQSWPGSPAPTAGSGLRSGASRMSTRLRSSTASGAAPACCTRRWPRCPTTWRGCGTCSAQAALSTSASGMAPTIQILTGSGAPLLTTNFRFGLDCVDHRGARNARPAPVDRGRRALGGRTAAVAAGDRPGCAHPECHQRPSGSTSSAGANGGGERYIGHRPPATHRRGQELPMPTGTSLTLQLGHRGTRNDRDSLRYGKEPGETSCPPPH